MDISLRLFACRREQQQKC